MRPELTNPMTEAQFLRWYWLKSELVSFCKSVSLPTHGQKPELMQRVANYLAGRAQPSTAAIRRAAKMPESFELALVIGEGWRCSVSLGQFFKEQCGPRFRFNAAVRDFIHHRQGATLADAVRCYEESVAPNAPRQVIIRQNQYNQHFRDYFLKNPQATRAEAIAAWKAKREDASIEPLIKPLLADND
jgi:hypothetical protein